jgi:hypothetical protein
MASALELRREGLARSPEADAPKASRSPTPQRPSSSAALPHSETKEIPQNELKHTCSSAGQPKMTLRYLFFVTGAQSTFFTVNIPTQVLELVKARPRCHADNVYRALITYGGELRARCQSADLQWLGVETEVSPWLEMTRWPRYFNGLSTVWPTSRRWHTQPIRSPSPPLSSSERISTDLRARSPIYLRGQDQRIRPGTN